MDTLLGTDGLLGSSTLIWIVLAFLFYTFFMG